MHSTFIDFLLPRTVFHYIAISQLAGMSFRHQIIMHSISLRKSYEYVIDKNP